MSSTAATAVSYGWPMPDTVLRWHKRPGRPWSRMRMTARYAASRTGFVSPRRNGAAIFIDGSPLNDKAAPFQRDAKGLVGRGLLGVKPDDQHTGGTQELHQPIKRGLKGFERAPPPID